MEKNENDDDSIYKIICEVLDSFGQVTRRISGNNIRLYRHNKLFGLIINKEIYLRITPKFFFFYPPETYGYYELKLRKFKLQEPVDREDLLRKIYQAYLIASEDGPYRFEYLQD